MERFPRISHLGCNGEIDTEGPLFLGNRETMLRCNACGAEVGRIDTGVLNDLVTLATDLDKFVPDAEHINALPAPLRSYIHHLETRADPSGDVQALACLRENVAALEMRVLELEASHAQLRGALIFAARRIIHLTFGRRDDKVLPVLRRVLRAARNVGRTSSFAPARVIKE